MMLLSHEVHAVYTINVCTQAKYMYQSYVKGTVNIVVDRRKKIELCWLTCINIFKWMNKRPRYKKKKKKKKKIIHSL